MEINTDKEQTACAINCYNLQKLAKITSGGGGGGKEARKGGRCRTKHLVNKIALTHCVLMVKTRIMACVFEND